MLTDAQRADIDRMKGKTQLSALEKAQLRIALMFGDPSQTESAQIRKLIKTAETAK